MKASAEALAAIETAIQIEENGLAFYSEMAVQVDNPQAKKMFQTLARDEVAHKKLFERVRQELQESGRWLSAAEVTALSPRTMRPAVFPVGEAVAGVEVPQRELAALQRGIQAEEESIAFYSQQKDLIDDPAAQEMFDYLIEQEKGHRTILQGEYDYLTNTGFWFDIREFDLEAMG